MKTLRPHGFTLLELMITVLIVAILTAIAAPNMSMFLQNDRLISFRNELFTALQFARSTSLSRNQAVILCVSSNGTSCTGGSFQGGWIVGIDLDNSGSIDGSDQILKVQQIVDNGIKFFSDLGTSSIAFDSRGFSPGTNGRISVCDERGDDYGRVITISVTGRIGRGENAKCS